MSSLLAGLRLFLAMANLSIDSEIALELHAISTRKKEDLILAMSGCFLMTVPNQVL